MGSLTVKEISALRVSIQEIMDWSCNHANADSQLFPKHWLFHIRWNARPGKVDASRPGLELLEIDGRTTVVDPGRQKEPEGVVIKRKPVASPAPNVKSKKSSKLPSKAPQRPHVKVKAKAGMRANTKVVGRSSSGSKSVSLHAKRKSAARVVTLTNKPVVKAAEKKTTRKKTAPAPKGKAARAKNAVMKQVRKGR